MKTKEFLLKGNVVEGLESAVELTEKYSSIGVSQKSISESCRHF